MSEASTSSIPASSRHRAREVALQALFALDLQNRSGRGRARKDRDAESDDSAQRVTDPIVGSEIFDGIVDHFEMPEAAKEFARELVVQISQRRESLDEVVSNHARNWRVDRMAVVDRNILRLATYELIHTSTPAAVILDESVELARRFGADASPPFVNGVLDAVAKEVRTEKSR